MLSQYLQYASNNLELSESVTQVLIEEFWQAYWDRWNSNMTPDQFKVRNIIKSHVQVYSNAEKEVVQKLSYWARGPFRIIKYTGSDSYGIQLYDDANGVVWKYKGTKIYLLPLEIYPREPLDIIDERYLNCEFYRVLSPFKNSLQLDIYNDKFFKP